MGAPTPLITVSHFSKSFGRHEVVRDLSFDVRRGEVFAFLGANGSGKTTTIRCLLNILQPTAGTLHVQGKPYTTEQASLVGYLPEERGLYTTANVLETMTYFGELKGLRREEAAERSLAFLERVGLAEKAGETIKKLSSGQQQKVQLGITVINQPSLLILDEPTKGLDPVNRTLLMDLLTEMNRDGATIIFITHQMEEVEKIADRLVMIHEGRRVLYGGVEEVKRQFGTNTIHLEFEGAIAQRPKLFRMKAERNHAELTPLEGIQTDEVLRELLAQGIRIISFDVAAPSLNDIFIQVSNRHA